MDKEKKRKRCPNALEHTQHMHTLTFACSVLLLSLPSIIKHISVSHFRNEVFSLFSLMFYQIVLNKVLLVICNS